MAISNDPLQAARALRTTIQQARRETEESRRLAPQVVQGLIESGLCRLAVPASLGGHEAAPLVTLQVYEELASVEASVAWVAWNHSLPALFSRHLTDTVRAELFGDAGKLFANSTRPSGRARIVDGGFRVSGRWSLVSGCELADWIPLMCVVTQPNEPGLGEDATPELRMMYLPKGSYRILDTWFVGGLRGTGSHDVVVEDVFVPTARTFAYMDPNRLDRPLYRMPVAATIAAGCAAICLGIAQTAIDALLMLAASKAQADAGPGLRDRTAVQITVATSWAALDAARLLVHESLNDLWGACKQGTSVTDQQKARLWSGTHHAAQTAKTVVTAMFEAAGTAALYVDSPLERAQRDIYAVGLHIILSPQWLEDAGRVRLGFTPNHPLF